MPDSCDGAAQRPSSIPFSASVRAPSAADTVNVIRSATGAGRHDGSRGLAPAHRRARTLRASGRLGHRKGFAGQLRPVYRDETAGDTHVGGNDIAGAHARSPRSAVTEIGAPSHRNGRMPENRSTLFSTRAANADARGSAGPMYVACLVRAEAVTSGRHAVPLPPPRTPQLAFGQEPVLDVVAVRRASRQPDLVCATRDLFLGWLAAPASFSLAALALLP